MCWYYFDFNSMLLYDISMYNKFLGLYYWIVYWVFAFNWMGPASNWYPSDRSWSSYKRYGCVGILLLEYNIWSSSTSCLLSYLDTLRSRSHRGTCRVWHVHLPMHCNPLYPSNPLLLHCGCQIQLVQVSRGNVHAWCLEWDGIVVPGRY